MKNINNITLVGTLVRDAETKLFPSGSSITNATIAVADDYKPVGEDLVKRSYFFELKLSNKIGEYFKEWAKKGSKVIIDGKLIQQTWEKDGQKQSKVLIDVVNFEVLSKGGAKPKEETAEPQKVEAPSAPQPTQEFTDNEIPF